MPPRRSDTTDIHTVSLDRNHDGSKTCCGLFAKKAPPFRQSLVLLRHSERQDRVDSSYKDSDEGKAWPFDAPITPAGIKLAASVAEELKTLHASARFSAVACSPYRRCIMTAAEVCMLLNLPLILDQEIGEIYDKEMPENPRPWRTPTQLVEMCNSLGVKVKNPLLAEGGYKLFGKVPTYPETLESAKTRYVVRIETYLEQSEETQQNFILCTHADAVAAALQLFERGNADVQDMEFCARLIATVSVKKQTISADDSVYKKHWDVEFKGMKADIMKADPKMEKLYEKMHIDNCEETNKVAVKRKQGRTQTDMMFASQLKDLPVDDDDSDDGRPPAKPKGKPKPKNAFEQSIKE